MDVYDEVDRRETDAGKVKLSSKICVILYPQKTFFMASLLTRILQNLHWCCGYTHTSKPDTTDLILIILFVVWLATQNHSTLVTETTVVPFLPVNPEYSSTRNQVSQLYRIPMQTLYCFPFETNLL